MSIETRTVIELEKVEYKLISEGKQGLPGRDASPQVVINILEPALTWNLPHFLGKFPNLQLFTTAGDQMFANYRHVDNNNILVTFSDPTNGIAYIN